ncbi:MAG TPA: TetR/AcrR family transcriptional regulator [Acidimicrobiales bacterium]|nr:TetR/AcrR family transcriptional regulator [Acidimicrobiales bacterium]
MASECIDPTPAALTSPTGRPLQKRAIDTRAALLDAAIDCLVERGYAATTTTETARRAHASRGAQLHHFPTKADLMTAAVARLLDRRVEEFRKAFVDVPPGNGRLEHAVDVLWSMFESPCFVAVAELKVAARTDPELASAVREMDRRFEEECRAVYSDLFPNEDGHDPEFDEMAVAFCFAVMDGVAFQRLTGSEFQRPVRDYLETLKAIATIFQTPTEPARRQS